MMSASAVQSRVPDGWSVESRRPNELTILAPHGGVTLDIGGRFYQLGFGIRPPRPYSMAQKYTGRGWRDRLVADAVKALEECREARP